MTAALTALAEENNRLRQELQALREEQGRPWGRRFFRGKP